MQVASDPGRAAAANAAASAVAVPAMRHISIGSRLRGEVILGVVRVCARGALRSRALAAAFCSACREIDGEAASPAESAGAGTGCGGNEFAPEGPPLGPAAGAPNGGDRGSSRALALPHAREKVLSGSTPGAATPSALSAVSCLPSGSIERQPGRRACSRAAGGTHPGPPLAAQSELKTTAPDPHPEWCGRCRSPSALHSASTRELFERAAPPPQPSPRRPCRRVPGPRAAPPRGLFPHPAGARVERQARRAARFPCYWTGSESVTLSLTQD
eukprot:291789-Chlamydomonas_euryale.AAC.4